MAKLNVSFKDNKFIRFHSRLHKLWPQVTIESYTNRVQRPVRRVQELTLERSAGYVSAFQCFVSRKVALAIVLLFTVLYLVR